jgi:aminomethyltransferase
MFTNADGGIIDDLMVTRASGCLILVVNAARKHVDVPHLQRNLPDCRVETLEDAALLALQGPAAGAVLGRLAPESGSMRFMTSRPLTIAGLECFATRSGYTGEDGFEISCAGGDAEALARALLAEPEVTPAGLGARDTLRLEAGLCLWGNDIDEATTPVEAGLSWTISPRRRREGGFPGDAVILGQLQDGSQRQRVGIRLNGRAPARGGATILNAAGTPVGIVTSGGYAPSVGGPVAMGYVAAGYAEPDTPLQLLVRDKPLAAHVVRMPFIEHRYVR